MDAHRCSHFGQRVRHKIKFKAEEAAADTGPTFFSVPLRQGFTPLSYSKVWTISTSKKEEKHNLQPHLSFQQPLRPHSTNVLFDSVFKYSDSDDWIQIRFRFDTICDSVCHLVCDSIRFMIRFDL